MAEPNPKRRLILMVTVLVLLLSTIALWSIAAYRRSEASFGEIGLHGAILILILAFMIPLLKSVWNNVRLGLPMHDERSKRITVLAGHYAFTVSIYAWLGIMYFEDHFTVNSAGAFAILVAAVTFGASYIVLSRRKKLD